jgi:hypothetical protein
VLSINQIAYMQRHCRTLPIVCELVRRSTSHQAHIYESHRRKSPDRKDKTHDRAIF